MKNILLVIALLTVTFLHAQERTVDLYGGKLFNLTSGSKIAYNGTTSDRLIPTTRDTIDYYIRLEANQTKATHFYANFTFDTVAGADTTIAITVQGKKFASETYADIIASAVTSAVSAELQVSKTSLGVTTEFTETQTIAQHTITGAAFTIKQDTATFKYYPADSLKVPATTFTEAAQTVTVTKVVNSSLYYGYLKFRLILQGNDSVGTGIKVKRIELQFF